MKRRPKPPIPEVIPLSPVARMAHRVCTRNCVPKGRAERIARPMRAAGIVDVSRRRGISTTRRDRNARPTPDLVDRNFTADRPNQLWVADITYVPTEARFLYLAVVLDVFGVRASGNAITLGGITAESPRPWHVAPLSARRATTTRAQDSVKVHPFTVRFSRVGSGAVMGLHCKRRRRIEFLDFMNRVVAQHQGKEIHVILNNLSTHKPKRDMWLRRHSNAHLHYTPTHASWLNQVEIWSSILAGGSLKGGSFGRVHELIDHIDSFIASYNDTAKP